MLEALNWQQHPNVNAQFATRHHLSSTSSRVCRMKPEKVYVNPTGTLTAGVHAVH
jgi:hypothetical protein